MLRLFVQVVSCLFLLRTQPTATQVAVVNTYQRSLSGCQLQIYRPESNLITSESDILPSTASGFEATPSKGAAKQIHSFNFDESHFMSTLLPYINENTLPFSRDTSVCIHKHQRLIKELGQQVRALRGGRLKALSPDYLATLMMIELFATTDEPRILGIFQAQFLPDHLNAIVNKKLLNPSIYLYAANRISLLPDYFLYAADFLPNYEMTAQELGTYNQISHIYIQKKIYQTEKEIYETLREVGSGETIRYLSRKIHEVVQRKNTRLTECSLTIFKLVRGALESGSPSQYFATSALNKLYQNDLFLQLPRLSLLVNTALQEHQHLIKNFVCHLQSQHL